MRAGQGEPYKGAGVDSILTFLRFELIGDRVFIFHLVKACREENNARTHEKEDRLPT